MLSSVYCIFFTGSDKVYYGSTRNFKRRKREHKSDLLKGGHANPILQNLYDKHGKENMIVEEIAQCPKEYQYKLEQWFITTQQPNINISLLARGCHVPSDGVTQYDLSGNFLNEYSSAREASRQSGVTLTGILKCCKSKINMSGGFMWHYTKNAPNKLRPYKRHFSKPVIQYSMDGEKLAEYPSARQAAKSNGLRHKEILLCCQGINHYGGDYQWRYKSDKVSSLAKSSRKCKPVLMYDLNGQFVREFDSVKSAAKYWNTSISNIVSNINGKYSHAKNHLWKFKNIN